MSYGFEIFSGSTGALVESVSTDNPPGVLVESFAYTWSTTPVTKTYSSFQGQRLLPILISVSNFGSSVTITVNNSAKEITITGVSTLTGRSDAQVVVLGL